MTEKRRSGLALVAAAALGMTLAAQGGAAAADAKGYVCTFETGAAQVYDKGRFAPAPAGAMNIEIVAIDSAGQTAQFKTARGTGLLKTVQATHATHFLEVATDGFMAVTTVYDRDDATGNSPAVHSRHFGVLGQPVVSQFFGVCREKP